MRDSLAINGGRPVRENLLPYGRQEITEADIEAVVAVLRSEWLTTGPAVQRFEAAVAEACGVAEAVAVSSGTAGLHAAMQALEIGPGDEVIVPAMTFAASANCVLYRGAVPVFADVDPDTLLIDPESVRERLTDRTKAIIAVDYAGQPCDYEALRKISTERGISLVADACHSLGGRAGGTPVGALADLSVFSFHPVKHITTGEGGMITTDSPALAARMRTFRNHGITTDHRERQEKGGWFYEMVELGYNYRLTDLQCALGESQLARHQGWVRRRNALARRYDEAFAEISGIAPLKRREGVIHAYHLYVVQIDSGMLDATRDEFFTALRAEGIGANVHYIPVHLHPYYRETLGTGPGLCPNAEASYEQILTLPLFPGMADSDADDVVRAVEKLCIAFRA